MTPDELDWNLAWKEEQSRKGAPGDAEFWNNRASTYAETAGQSDYVVTFIERARVEPGESILDMGCGSGTLSIPFAREGHHVVAVDFSEAMLEELMRRARQEGVADNIEPMLLSWDDDWNNAGVPSCDVAIASRSIATADLQDALTKLDAHALRRVCITLTMGLSPRVDEVLLRAIGRKPPRYPDGVFAFNILWGMGIHPDLSYIVSAKESRFSSFDEAIDMSCEVLQADPAQRELLIEYSRRHLHELHDDAGASYWEYDHVRTSSWAFLSWTKNRPPCLPSV